MSVSKIVKASAPFSLLAVFGAIRKFSTSSKVQGTSGGCYWECNLVAVWGQMATGGGYAPLSESMAVPGVLSLSKKAFMSTWTVVVGSLKKSLKQAGEEEKTIVISKGHHHQGIPANTVIVDGGWSKRSHKHSYNAKSGVGNIIGKETGKILYMEEYCSVCHNTTGDTISPHECLKPSTEISHLQPWRLT